MKRFNARRKLKGAVQSVAGGCTNDPLCGDTDSGSKSEWKIKQKSLSFIICRQNSIHRIIFIYLKLSYRWHCIGNVKWLGRRRGRHRSRSKYSRFTRWHPCSTRSICRTGYNEWHIVRQQTTWFASGMCVCCQRYQNRIKSNWNRIKINFGQIANRQNDYFNFHIQSKLILLDFRCVLSHSLLI